MKSQHHRARIWNKDQHPYKHSLSEFAFVNDALPGVTNVEGAITYMLNVLFPNVQSAVATPSDLPAAGNTISDYRVVLDDGDGKQAAYRWEQREGDVAAQWYKVADMDWSNDSILAQLMDVTQPLYVSKGGRQDIDANGDPVAGLYAGQFIYGGTDVGSHLTLNSNSGDGTGAQSGYVQIDSNFRPTQDALYDLSTSTERWRDAHFSGVVNIGTVSISGNTIVDSTGTLELAATAVNTTGNITGGLITGTSLVADNTTNSVTLVPGSYTDSSGSVDFGAANLITTGTLGAGVATFTQATETLTLTPSSGVAGRASITTSQDAIDFLAADLYTTGGLFVGALSADSLDIDNLRLDGNTISSTDVDGDITLLPNGNGVVDVQNTLRTVAQEITGDVTQTGNVTQTGATSITGLLDVDNLRFDGNAITSTEANGSITLLPTGTGTLSFGSNLLPTSSGSFDLGSTTSLLKDTFISGGIRNATNEIDIGTLLTLRTVLYRDLAKTDPAQTGDTIFYDAVNGVFLASTADSEVDHATIAGLTVGDGGHTQLALLAGRPGGQLLVGSTDPSGALTLKGTADATAGFVRTEDTFTPSNTAVYAAGWSGTDLGASTHTWNDVYTSGEFKGFRLENVLSTALPPFSMQNRGRLVWATDNNKAYVDLGTGYKVLGVAKFVGDQVFDGVQVSKDVDVSAGIEDARLAQWQLMDNANNFEIMAVSITATTASNIRITTNIPLPASSYRLIGIE